MPSKGRGRTESLALRVVAPGGSTLLRSNRGSSRKKPLAGCDVYAYPAGQEGRSSR